MGLPLILIIIGIVLALLVNPLILGIIVILIGLALLLVPYLGRGPSRV